MDGMNEYHVEYEQYDLIQVFQCWSDDEDHAKDFFKDESDSGKIRTVKEV